MLGFFILGVYSVNLEHFLGKNLEKGLRAGNTDPVLNKEKCSSCSGRGYIKQEQLKQNGNLNTLVLVAKQCHRCKGKGVIYL